MKNIRTFFVGVLACFIVLFFVNRCSEKKQPKTLTKTEVKIVKRTDTIIKTVFSEPKKVFVIKEVAKDGSDSIVHVDRNVYFKDTTTIAANNYKTRLEANNASAELEITTTGELLDVQGTINYDEKETTTETIIYKNNSGLFLYGKSNINNFHNVEVGALFQLKNKVFLSGGISYDNFTQKISPRVGIGIKIY